MSTWYKKEPTILDKSNLVPPSPKEVTAKIEELISEFGMISFEINNGNCDEFAELLYDNIAGAILLETDLDSGLPTHVFIKVGDFYYDAESPNGVSDWRKLNIFKNSFTGH